jgi:aldose 1-epimerase
MTLVWCAAASAGTVQVKAYGITKDGRPVKAYTLTNDTGASATILDYGAAIAAIRVPDRNGKLGNTVLSFADIAGWETFGHANAIIGRVANRITRGFTLDGVYYPLMQNAQGITSHGGPHTYTSRLWSVVSVRSRRDAAIVLALDSPDGDQGFPGRVRIRATYRFGNDNRLRLDMVATTSKATPINLTNHIYFNLTGNSTVPVYDHTLQMMTDRTAVMEPGTSPTGEIVPVAGTPFDFRKPTVLKERLALSLGPRFADPATAPPVPAGMVRSFSRPYVLRDGDNRLDRVAARLHDPVSGRVMELSTTETTVHLFTPAQIRGDLLSDAGRPFTPVPAVALETQHLPDSPNRPEFPSIILRPGRTYRTTTIFAFKTDVDRSP